MTKKKTLCKDGLYDPWMLSDLFTLMDKPQITQSSKNTIVINSEKDIEKELFLRLDKDEIWVSITNDWDNIPRWSCKDYLAIMGFAKKYDLGFSEYEN